MDLLSERAGKMRDGFHTVNSISGSKIDSDITFKNFIDVLKHSPRALQIGFLSPFPSHWIEIGKETGLMGRIISGVETIIWYVIITGFLFLIMRNISILEPLLPLLIIATIVIVLLGFIVPNFGAIYRMRQGYMIPFYIFGVHGALIMMQSLVARLRKK